MLLTTNWQLYSLRLFWAFWCLDTLGQQRISLHSARNTPHFTQETCYCRVRHPCSPPKNVDMTGGSGFRPQSVGLSKHVHTRWLVLLCTGSFHYQQSCRAFRVFTITVPDKDLHSWNDHLLQFTAFILLRAWNLNITTNNLKPLQQASITLWVTASCIHLKHALLWQWGQFPESKSVSLKSTT